MRGRLAQPAASHPGERAATVRTDGPLGPLIVVAAALLLTLPVIVGGHSVGSPDGVFHFQFYGQFARQLSGGELYPRWLMELNAGLGTPAMFVYPPVPYYLTWALAALLPGAADAWHQLGHGAGLAVVLAGLAAYLWLRRLAERQAALAGALLYLAFPYNVASTLYNRGAYTELWSFAWAPLLFLGAELCLGRARFAVPMLALAYALLLATHLPMAFVFTLALALNVAWRAIRDRNAGTATMAVAMQALHAPHDSLPVHSTAVALRSLVLKHCVEIS